MTSPPAAGLEGTAWNTPPVDQAGTGDVPPPSKKTRSWRRGSQKSETPPPASAPPAGTLPPSEPPPNPVLLSPGTLPQPPAPGQGPAGAPGPVVWKPPVDPVTGETVWDSAAPSPDFMAPEPTAAKKPRPWRRGSKAANAGMAAGGAAAGAAAIAGGNEPRSDRPGGRYHSLGPGLGTSTPTPAPGSWTAGPGEVAGDASAEPFGAAVPPSPPPDETVPPTTGEPAAKGVRATGRHGRPVVLLVVVIVGGGVYYLRKNHNNNPTTTPSVTSACSDIGG